MLYDFLIYQGNETEIKTIYSKFGLGASVVLHLTDRISFGHHFLYFDNFFSSFNLFEVLKQKGIKAAGTIRVNRFENPPLMPDRELSKAGRGACDEVVSKCGNIVLVKWFDNKAVVLASNFVGIGQKDEIERWDKTKKTYIKVERPEIVKVYNTSMGGVDLFDQCMSYYRIWIKSKKWTLRMIFHAIDTAVVNSWLEYRRDCERFGILKKDTLDQLHFRFRLAKYIIYVGNPRTPTSKGGRPSNVETIINVNPGKRVRKETRPEPEIQLDMIDHMPEYDEHKEATRCKAFGCKGKTHVFYTKCHVHLCFAKGRNCFKQYHCVNKRK